ncbi:hypothetical protein HDU96_000647 [Phlyctochytrium bullatum]|nr:hypothetical protein HDU96_000647 [Phlyctochytrium bullatum]
MAPATTAAVAPPSAATATATATKSSPAPLKTINTGVIEPLNLNLYDPEPSYEDCAVVNKIFPFFDPRYCCGTVEFKTGPVPDITSTIQCDPVTRRITTWEMVWWLTAAVSDAKCSFESCSQAISLDGIGKLTELTHLYFDIPTPVFAMNWPKDIGNLRKLRTLKLAGAFVGKIPEGFGQLSTLKQLFFNNTPLKELPGSIVQTKNLRGLFLYDTDIQSVPPVVGSLMQLEDFVFHRLTLVGSIPSTLRNLRNLYRLEILAKTESIAEPTLPVVGSQLVGLFPEFLLELPNLRYLHISGGFLGGELPSWNDTAVAKGLGSTAFFSKDAPPARVGEREKKVFAIPRNRFSGSFLTELVGRLPSFIELYVGGNCFDIPTIDSEADLSQWIIEAEDQDNPVDCIADIEALKSKLLWSDSYEELVTIGSLFSQNSTSTASPSSSTSLPQRIETTTDQARAPSTKTSSSATDLASTATASTPTTTIASDSNSPNSPLPAQPPLSITVFITDEIRLEDAGGSLLGIPRTESQPAPDLPSTTRPSFLTAIESRPASSQPAFTNPKQTTTDKGLTDNTPVTTTVVEYAAENATGPGGGTVSVAVAAGMAAASSLATVILFSGCLWLAWRRRERVPAK